MHRAAFYCYFICILVDKLYSSFELVIGHESKTTIVVKHRSSVHVELYVNVTRVLDVNSLNESWRLLILAIVY